MRPGQVAPRVPEEFKPCHALMAAVIRQAIMEHDREWLEGEQCETFCIFLGLDHGAVMDAKPRRRRKGRP